MCEYQALTNNQVYYQPIKIISEAKNSNLMQEYVYQNKYAQFAVFMHIYSAYFRICDHFSNAYMPPFKIPHIRGKLYACPSVPHSIANVSTFFLLILSLVSNLFRLFNESDGYIQEKALTEFKVQCKL